MALESIEKLRELACDINGNEIVDHMQLYPSCVFDGAWLNSWHCKFDRELEALEREIADKYLLLPVDADGVPIHVGDKVKCKFNDDVREVGYVGKCGFHEETHHYFDAENFTHVKPDPVKELLRQYRNELEELIQGGFGNVDSLTDDFAARIREAVEK